jgi:hypothetical protein
VVDIGGGSTEFIIGQNIDPMRLESLYMGCVSFSLRFFPDGKVDKRAFKEAELAARRELQAIVHEFREAGWDEAIGSSGTAKALVGSAGTERLVGSWPDARRLGKVAHRADRGRWRVAAETGRPAPGSDTCIARWSGHHVGGIQGVRPRTHGVFRGRLAPRGALRPAGAPPP